MFFENSLFLKEDELDVIISNLPDNYSADSVRFVHMAILLSPALINSQVLPQPQKTTDIFNPAFRISSLHIASTLRIMGLDIFGLFYFLIAKELQIDSWMGINDIVTVMQRLASDYEYLHLSNYVDIERSSEKLFSSEPFFEESSIIDEIDFCSDTMQFIKADSNKFRQLNLSELIELLDDDDFEDIDEEEY